MFLFNEQWVVKGPDRGIRFSWHQDSGYVKFRDPATTHRPYLNCWCALDDVDESNGTSCRIYVVRRTGSSMITTERRAATIWLATQATIRESPSSRPRGTSRASRASICTAAAPTDRVRRGGSTLTSTVTSL